MGAKGSRLYHLIAPRILSRTGAQLMLEDTTDGSASGEKGALGEEVKPLLLRMTEPGTFFSNFVSSFSLFSLFFYIDSSYMRGLGLFKRRVLYACIAGDYTVPYCTAAIRSRNPYRVLQSYDETFQSYFLEFLRTLSSLSLFFLHLSLFLGTPTV